MYMQAPHFWTRVACCVPSACATPHCRRPNAYAYRYVHTSGPRESPTPRPRRSGVRRPHRPLPRPPPRTRRGVSGVRVRPLRLRRVRVRPLRRIGGRTATPIRRRRRNRNRNSPTASNVSPFPPEFASLRAACPVRCTLSSSPR